MPGESGVYRRCTLKISPPLGSARPMGPRIGVMLSCQRRNVQNVES